LVELLLSTFNQESTLKNYLIYFF